MVELSKQLAQALPNRMIVTYLVKDISNRIKEHPMQKNHIAACETLSTTICDKTIDLQISQ